MPFGKIFIALQKPASFNCEKSSVSARKTVFFRNVHKVRRDGNKRVTVLQLPCINGAGSNRFI